VGLFSPYQRKDKTGEPAEPTPQPEAAQAGRTKKSVPTPTRKEAEEARRNRVNPRLNPREAKARDRQASREARAKAMAESDAAVGKILVRDYLDSRWTLGEFLMPMMIVTILVTILAQQVWGESNPVLASNVMTWAISATYALLIGTIVEIVLRWFDFKRLLRQKYPKESPKGLLFYFSNRAISIRGMRNPRPAVRRGEKP
jgi:hypothetical protein